MQVLNLGSGEEQGLVTVRDNPPFFGTVQEGFNGQNSFCAQIEGKGIDVEGNVAGDHLVCEFLGVTLDVFV